jgi:hypothetical protein
VSLAVIYNIIHTSVSSIGSNAWSHKTACVISGDESPRDDKAENTTNAVLSFLKPGVKENKNNSMFAFGNILI